MDFRTSLAALTQPTVASKVKIVKFLIGFVALGIFGAVANVYRSFTGDSALPVYVTVGLLIGVIGGLVSLRAELARLKADQRE